MGFSRAHVHTLRWGLRRIPCPEGAEAQEEHHPQCGRATTGTPPHQLCRPRVSTVFLTALAPRAVPVPPAAALTAKPWDHLGEAKQCRLVWAQPHTVGLALSLCHGVCQASGVSPARLSQVCLLLVGTSQPALKLPSCWSQREQQEQGRTPQRQYFLEKSTLNKQPAACTLSAHCLHAACRKCTCPVREQGQQEGPSWGSKASFAIKKALSQFSPYFSCPLTHSFFKITFFSRTQRHLCSLPFFLKIIL